MTVKYTITFLDYWHIGSGLSAGAKLDSSVLKDGDKLPFIGGKTIKGLVREMAELLGDGDFVNICFGASSDEKDKYYNADMKNIQGECYFSNATLNEAEKEQIVSYKLQDYLYEEIASTQIDASGMAVDGSLREIEVTIPVTLQGEIDDVPEAYSDKISKALRMVKRMGLNRNRGLGRCGISVEVVA